MSFDLGSIVGGLAKAVLPAVIDSVFPEAMLVPGLTNMISDMIGDQLGKAIDGAMQQSGSPGFQIKDVLDMLKQAVQGAHQPCDPGCGDEIKHQFGGIAQNMVDDLIKDFTDALKNYKNDSKNCDHGGKGGKGGSAGGAGNSGPVTFRDLAAALGQLEQDEAKRVKDKVQAASDALGQADQAGTGKDGAVTQGDNDKNAQNKQDQFKAMEESKAEAQIFQTLSSAISEVMKNFGGALQTAARGG
jgi:hypothetical protein